MSGNRLSCWKCNQGISPGQSFLNALGHTWHETCFSCRTCNSRLGTGEFYTVNNEPYCSQCHVTQDVPNCVKCSQPVRRGVDFLKYEGHSYHAHCFVCDGCNRELSTSDFFKHDGRRYCPNCSDNMSRSTSNSSPSYGSGSSSYGGNSSYGSNNNSSSPYSGSTASAYGSSSTSNPTPTSTYGSSGSTYGSSGASAYGNKPASTYGSSSNNYGSNSSYGSQPDHYAVAVEIDEPHHNNNDYTAEISIGVVPTHDTMSASHHATHHDGNDGNDANDLNALVAELESSGSDFNSKYGGTSTYNSHQNADDSDPLAAALKSLQEFEG